ncbi:MAG TPA: translation initiation factor IF-2 [Thermodesulfobacteriaceae bacterium]|nr:translation initiation factor IF-2 [Thermodesulfobacteriaceae bacterium]
MAKVRVHELAKELGIPSKEMAAKIKELGYNIKNYMSTLEGYEADEIRVKLRTKPETEEKAKPKVVVRRRQRVVHLKKIVRPQPGEPEITPPPEPVLEKKAEESAVIKKETAEPEPLPPTAEEASVPEELKKAEEEKQPGAKTETAAAEAPEAGEPEAVTKPEEEKKAEPKRFVKILDRPRIEITQPKARPQKTAPSKPARPGRKAAPTAATHRPSVPAGAHPAPGKKGKKKGKRVVQTTEFGPSHKKKRPMTKKKGRLKPINKIVEEEMGMIDTMAGPGAGRESAKRGGRAQPTPKPGTLPAKAGKRKFTVYETIQVSELAKRMGIKASDVIMKLMGLGVMATANQSIDFDVASLVASEFDYEVEKKAVAEDLIHIEEIQFEGGEPVPRPPVVTVMGHVDHGKTSLLDAIRKADVASQEAGGITQHIGAHHVMLDSGQEVVFLDTPGHEAFTAMRLRGAQVTDIVILIVAADDGVMAQTKEAIDHAKAAGVPIIVAINKIDKPGANPEKVKGELAELGLIPEDWGGDTIFVEISAKQGTGIDDLLDMMGLQAEVLELKADPRRPAKGHVIEAKLDKGRGPVATLLVSEGTLHVGDALVCGLHHGRIRAMLNDKGDRIREAGPSIPVEVQGLSGVPDAGNEFTVLPNEKKAREVAEYRQRKAREAELLKTRKLSLENVFEKLQEDALKELDIVLKTDVRGSLEALTESLQKLSTEKIKVRIVRGGIGAISESDVLLASASNAIIIGFNVKPSLKAKALAEHENVDIRFYDVIYHAIEEVKGAMAGLLEPVYREKVLGRAEVRDTFHITKVGTVAGCYVTEGIMRRNAQARLLRDNVVVYTGKVNSLRRFKEDAKEVQAGYECGAGLEKFNDIKVGDVIETFEMEELAPSLGESLDDRRSGQAQD